MRIACHRSMLSLSRGPKYWPENASSNNRYRSAFITGRSLAPAWPFSKAGR